MKDKINKVVDSLRDELISDLRAVISIPSKNQKLNQMHPMVKIAKRF